MDRKKTYSVGTASALLHCNVLKLNIPTKQAGIKGAGRVEGDYHRKYKQRITEWAIRNGGFQSEKKGKAIER